MSNGENEIENLYKTYLNIENDFEQKMRERNKLRHDLRSTRTATTNFDSPRFRLSTEERQKRNIQLLKDVELAKARLRTLSSFTPTDQELRRYALDYSNIVFGKDRASRLQSVETSQTPEISGDELTI